MLFNSLTFFIFLAVVLGLYCLPMSWAAKKVMLLFASYVFYAAWNPFYVWLLAVSTLVDFHLASKIYAATTLRQKRWLLAASLAVNLGLLSYFKYADFMLQAAVDLFAGLGVHYQPPAADIILPLGISFFTFQTLSYTLDVYFGRLKPWRSFWDYALFVSFFPQLVAGPIVRAKEFLPQLLKAKHINRANLGWGMALLTIGLFAKTVLADDVMARLADLAYGTDVGDLAVSGAAAWVGTLAFSAQIFFDFAGYSSCAIGVGLMLGFHLPRNFRFPYAAVGFSDFWRRWHISLSQWLRDYLYIPLGGNRCGRFKRARNLAITMLLGGLWHGAAWTFVIWGALHGLYLIIEAMLRAAIAPRDWMRNNWVQLPMSWLTFVAVSLAWVLFRSADFGQASYMLTAMLSWQEGVWPYFQSFFVWLGMASIVLMLAGHWYFRNRDVKAFALGLPVPVQTMLLTTMWFLILVTPGENKAFIYFQF